MKIDLNSALTLVSLVFMLVGGIYRLAQIEANINLKIKALETHLLGAVDALRDSVVERLYSVEKKLDIHLVEYQHKEEHRALRIKYVESQLVDAITTVKENAHQVHVMDKTLDIHLTDYSNKKEYYDYRIHVFDQQLEHKFNRLVNLIKQLSGFLNKQSGFVMRDDEY